MNLPNLGGGSPVIFASVLVTSCDPSLLRGFTVFLLYRTCSTIAFTFCGYASRF